MSRIGKKPVSVPAGVTVKLTPDSVSVKGPKGELAEPIPGGITLAWDEKRREVAVARASDVKEHRALHGTLRALLQNMVTGVTQGYEKRLRIVGTGYRVELKGKDVLSVTAGLAHTVEFKIPKGIEIEVPKSPSRESMDFIVKGVSKCQVGEIAAQLRRVRPPDLYLGKGIRYADEKVRKLEGKSFGAGGSK